MLHGKCEMAEARFTINCHMPFWVENKIQPDEIDSVIVVELPNQQNDPILYDIVTKICTEFMENITNSTMAKTCARTSPKTERRSLDEDRIKTAVSEVTLNVLSIRKVAENMVIDLQICNIKLKSLENLLRKTNRHLLICKGVTSKAKKTTKPLIINLKALKLKKIITPKVKSTTAKKVAKKK
ncbi:hypothetical protein EVAR_70120_1 [Eumeta japonica]|uniref:Uncharacterized protein n=1 Tax=Eumeta variegata TaxID=151549 RepID=A0A4C1Z8T6_EUMVA|nr:hypothetical protein EVAR_70120_1 [Eumeta japonica]